MADSGAISALFGEGSIIRTILVWQVLGQLISPLVTPMTQELSNLLNSRFTQAPLSPEVAADLVLKGWISEAEGQGIAAQSAISGDAFRKLLDAAGEPPGLLQLLEAYRRQIIDQPRLVKGIRESRVRDEWIDVIEALGFVPIGLSDAVDAAVENQIPYADAEHIGYQNGIKPADFRILFNTRGNPPAPSELIELVRRGFIGMTGTGPDALSLQQGISEGATKDKWIPAFEKLVDYHPPPRTVTALLRHGSLDHATALQLFKDAGLSDTLAAAYVADATNQKLAGQKELARGTILQLYGARVIDEATATSLIETLGYTAQEVAWLLAYEDMARELKAVNSAVTRIGTNYIAHRLGDTAALNALNALAIPHAQVDELMTTWRLGRSANVRIPSEAQIVDAHHYQIIDQATAVAELGVLGYAPHDAWLLLSVREHAKLPDEPAPGPGPAG